MRSETNKWWKTKKSKIVFLISACVSIVGLFIYFFVFYRYVSTDDARVAAQMLRIAPLLQSGRIISVHVKEGDRVKKGDLLVELDHNLAEAGLLKARATLTYATKELARYSKGYMLQVTMQHDLDVMQREVDVAQAELQIAQARYDDTFLKSPVNGVVVQKIAEVGNLLEAQQTALVIANVENAWVSANIEETSIKLIHPGQSVQIYVDEGYNLKGSVEEVIRATASQFALIPSDNASGNFTKVVQRIPIKVALEPNQTQALRVGQSVELKVRVH